MFRYVHGACIQGDSLSYLQRVGEGLAVKLFHVVRLLFQRCGSASHYISGSGQPFCTFSSVCKCSSGLIRMHDHVYVTVLL